MYDSVLNTFLSIVVLCDVMKSDTAAEAKNLFRYIERSIPAVFEILTCHSLNTKY